MRKSSKFSSQGEGQRALEATDWEPERPQISRAPPKASGGVMNREEGEEEAREKKEGDERRLESICPAEKKRETKRFGKANKQKMLLSTQVF